MPSTSAPVFRACGLTLIVAMLLAVQGAAAELADPVRAVAPIVHQRYFRGERELFGYAPKFAPGTISFDLENRPYIRDGTDVQTLSPAGTWLRRSFADEIAAYLSLHGMQPTFQIDGGTHLDTRVVFDWSGDAYTAVRIKRGTSVLSLLLYSKDRCQSWQVYGLPAGDARVEFQDAHNRLAGPPSVLVFRDRWLGLILPGKTANGKLTLPRPITIANDSLLTLNHSGGGNSSITTSSAVFVVYPGATPVPGKPGTPQYVARYGLARKSLGARVLLGTGLGPAPDPHDMPAISIDSKGVLHVVLGGHHQDLRYTRTTAPAAKNNTWTSPVALGAAIGTPSPRYTYVGLLCDADDTLHVVTRWTDPSYKFCLAALRKPAASDRWEQRLLVAPFRTMYSVWYHKVSLDRTNRLFIDYRYYGNQYNADEVLAYEAKWPKEDLGPPQANWINNVLPHDPAALMSDDGRTWRLAVTPNFTSGIAAAANRDTQ